MAEIERDVLPVDALFVGGGPASLAGALRLAQLAEEHNRKVQEGAVEGEPLELEIAIIEKGETPGACGLSGALLNPRALEELIPDYRQSGFPVQRDVHDDRMLYLTRSRAITIPGFMHPASNEGMLIVSLQKVVDWLAEKVEEKGVYLLTGTTGVEILYEGDRVKGVRTGDKGLDHEGKPMGNFEPGALIEATVTAFGEGPRGTLTEDLKERFDLHGTNPQIYSIGVKEIVEVPNKPNYGGLALHSMGWPMPYGMFGGGFLYELDDRHMSVGWVMGLDYDNPHVDAQRLLQAFKSHPAIRPFLEGGEVISYGAKTIPEGGYHSLPKVYVDGAVIIGDSAGFVSMTSLKGIHYAMKSGMLAAEAMFEALLAGDPSADRLASYKTRLDSSYVMRDLYEERNFRLGFTKSFTMGLLKAGLYTKVWSGPRRPQLIEPDFTHSTRRRPLDLPPLPKDDPLFINKMTAVHLSRTGHREDQPSHIRIIDQGACVDACIPAHGVAPCENFCPAGVYELVEEEGKQRIQINFSNCVHCKTCVIKDPYDVRDGDGMQNIDWRAPSEGGPRYQLL